LGTTAAGTTVNTGGQLQTSGALNFAEPLTLNGTGIATDGALQIAANAPTFSGAITLGSSGVRIQHNGASGAIISGGITGAGNNLTIFTTTGMTINTNPVNLGSGTFTKDGASGTI